MKKENPYKKINSYKIDILILSHLFEVRRKNGGLNTRYFVKKNEIDSAVFNGLNDGRYEVTENGLIWMTNHTVNDEENFIAITSLDVELRLKELSDFKFIEYREPDGYMPGACITIDGIKYYLSKYRRIKNFFKRNMLDRLIPWIIAILAILK